MHHVLVICKKYIEWFGLEHMFICWEFYKSPVKPDSHCSDYEVT
jgi:hypothetical protein